MKLFHIFFVFLLLTSCSNIPKDNVEENIISQNEKLYYYVLIKNLVAFYVPDPDPYYPSNSKKNGEEGSVITRLFINQNGVVDEVRLMKSSSYSRLDRAAMEISKRYRFKPCIKDSRPVDCYTNLEITFNLKK